MTGGGHPGLGGGRRGGVTTAPIRRLANAGPLTARSPGRGHGSTFTIALVEEASEAVAEPHQQKHSQEIRPLTDAELEQSLAILSKPVQPEKLLKVLWRNLLKAG